MDDRNDPHAWTPSGESLLVHRGFLRRMARDLARDGDEAEELEQETWVAALRHGARAGDASWLARAMRGLARTRRRATWRRVDRERRGSRSERDAREEDPETLALRLEQSQRLVQAVLELGEPQRRVVLLHYEAELSTAAIAERLGMPATTVCTHLRRARERLRARLDRGEGGRAAWAAVLVPRSTSSAPAAAALSIGGIALMGKMAIVAAVGLALAAGWWAWRPVEEETALVESVEEPRAEVDPRLDASNSITAEIADDMTRSAIAPGAGAASHASAPGWWLVGTIAGPPDEDPPRVRVEMSADEKADALRTLQSGTTLEIALDELFAEHPSLRGLRLRFDHPDFLPEERWIDFPEDLAPAPGERRELRCDVELRGAAAIVEGTVLAPLTPTELEVCAALLRLDPKGHRVPELVEQVACDARGSFRLRAAEVGPHVLVAAERPRDARLGHGTIAGRSRPETRRLDLQDGILERVQLQLGEGESLAGRALDAAGEPLADVPVTARLASQPRSVQLEALQIGWIDAQFELTEAAAHTAADGSFRISGLAPAEYRIACMHFVRDLIRSDSIPTMALWSGEAPATDQLRAVASAVGLELRAAFRQVELEVTSAGAPIATAEVRILHPDGEGSQASMTDEHGRYRVRFGAGMELDVEVTKPGYLVSSFELPLAESPPDGRLRVEMTPGPSGATLVLLLECQAPEREAILALNMFPWPHGSERPSIQASLRERLWIREPRWPASDLAEVGTFDPGRYVLQVGVAPAPDRPRSYLLPSDSEVFLPAGSRVEHRIRFELGGRLVVLVPSPPRDARRLSGSIEDDGGAQVHLVFNTVRPGSGWHPDAGLALGRNELDEALPPGDYVFVPKLGRTELERIPFTLEAGRETELTLDLDE